MSFEEKPDPAVVNVGCSHPSDETQDSSSSKTETVAAEDLIPRQDGGSEAWTFLTAASIVEMVAWGESKFISWRM